MRESFVVADDGTQLYTRVHEGPAAPRGGLEGVVSILCDGIACDGFIWKYLWGALAARPQVAHVHNRGPRRSQKTLDAEAIDVPANVHGPNIEWRLMWGNGTVEVKRPTFASDFNKDLLGLRPGEFSLCATVKGVEGCLHGFVIP